MDVTPLKGAAAPEKLQSAPQAAPKPAPKSENQDAASVKLSAPEQEPKAAGYNQKGQSLQSSEQKSAQPQAPELADPEKEMDLNPAGL